MEIVDYQCSSPSHWLNLPGWLLSKAINEERGFGVQGVLVVLALSISACSDDIDVEYSPCLDAVDGPSRSIATQWAPCVDWTVENPSYSDNPFDVVANVTFEHSSSGDQHSTQMFYDGGDSWKWRFTGTRVGNWTFETSSDDSDLHGLTGEIDVIPNPDPHIRGFLTHVGNKYAHMTDEDGTGREAYLFNVYMNGYGQPHFVNDFPSDLTAVKAAAQTYLAEALSNGTEVIFLFVLNNWFRFGASTYDEHTSENPDPSTFRLLEAIITALHDRGGRVHLWAWGDEQRKWTPEGVGGINGKPDRRLQRYIAARLGPLPGWTLGFGFDLHEWATKAELESWAEYLHDHLAWQHLLTSRGVRLEKSSPNINAYSSGKYGDELETDEPYGPHSFAEMLYHMRSDTSRPHLYEERHTYNRPGYSLHMDGTRRKLWWAAMAGGMGFFIGFYDREVRVFKGYPYPKSEQLRTYYEFWHTKRRFRLDHEVDTTISDGLALRSGAGGCYIFYKENATAIKMDLSRMAGSQTAVAVDLRRSYSEVEIGRLIAESQSWTAPVRSDWAIAVGCASRGD